MGILDLKHPVERWIVTNWDNLEKIWRHTFYEELHTDPKDHNVLLADAPAGPKASRERMAEIVFESFICPGLLIVLQPVLSLYATGRITGIVLESGDSVSHAVPVYEGYSLPHATLRMDVGGRDLTKHIVELMNDRFSSFTTSSKLEFARDIKETCCFVADEIAPTEASKTIEILKSYTLPDGRMVTLAKERFLCPEALFHPERLRMRTPGVHVTVYKSIMKCDVDIREMLYENIILAGGSTMFPGMRDRMYKEMVALAPSAMKVFVASSPERKYLAWIGGSILASLSSSKNMWTSKPEYEESGASAVHKDCFNAFASLGKRH